MAQLIVGIRLAQADGGCGKIAAAQSRFLEVDVGKKHIDDLVGIQKGEGFLDAVGGQGLIAPVLQCHLGDLTNEGIVFDD